MPQTKIKPAEFKMKTKQEWRKAIQGVISSKLHNGGLETIIEAIQQDAIRSVQPTEGLSDKEMLD